MLLSDEEIEARLGAVEGWSRDGDAIVREFERGDFVGSVRFAEALVEPAEELGHHPDLEISWATVTVRISTHSEGGLTAADFELAVLPGVSGRKPALPLHRGFFSCGYGSLMPAVKARVRDERTRSGKPHRDVSALETA